ncbi:unnamed protein product [Symbiodinium sp. KB8]|nr:unnamed protein product [Symbiodinium sp. KB8]
MRLRSPSAAMMRTSLWQLRRSLCKRCVASKPADTISADDNMLCKVGMHRGRPLQDLVAEDPRYCRWMLRMAEDPTSCNALRQNAAWLGKHAPHLKEPHGHNRGTDMLVRGGKHDGKSMAKVLSEDPWYCRWVLQAAKAGNASLNVEEMAAWLAENAQHLEEDGVCASGHNHRGRPLSELVVHDPSYCHWILRTAQDQDSTPGVQVQAAWLMENAPHLKELPFVRTGAYKGVPLVQVAAEDPRWCRFVMQQPKARSQGFAQSAAWLRKNVPQLLDVREDDDGAIDEIRQKFFKRHGKLFVVRFGKHRMKTFQRTVEEAPRYVRWVEQLVAAGGPRTALSVNFELLAAFARQQRSEEHITEKTAPTHLEELRQPLPDALPDAFAHKAAVEAWKGRCGGAAYGGSEEIVEHIRAPGTAALTEGSSEQLDMASPSAVFLKKLETFLKRIRKWDTEFLCIGKNAAEVFNVPKPEEVVPRITANLDYFSVNYAVCLAVFALTSIVVYPQLLVLVCVFSGLWYGLLTRPNHMRLQIANALLTKRHLIYALGSLNALVVLVFYRMMIFAIIGASLMFVLLHAGLHAVPANAKGKVAEEEGSEQTAPIV